MTRAFFSADVDKSGFVDEGEFLQLYAHCKGGNMKGLARSSSFTGSFFGKKKELSISSSPKRGKATTEPAKSLAAATTTKADAAAGAATSTKSSSAPQRVARVITADDPAADDPAADAEDSIKNKNNNDNNSGLPAEVADFLVAEKLGFLVVGCAAAYVTNSADRKRSQLVAYPLSAIHACILDCCSMPHPSLPACRPSWMHKLIPLSNTYYMPPVRKQTR
jgi:hypothetical protein